MALQDVWPAGFHRIPDDEWVAQPPETLALTYDTVQDHGWYRNLDPTIERLTETLRPGDILLDYSGGTGILAERLLARVGSEIGILIVDASPKFLRVALDKLGADERVGFRLIRYLKDERRLQTVQEAIDTPLLERGVDAVSSTNAIHLYYDLEDTLRSWRAVLRSGGPAFIQSGNIGVPDLPDGSWIIDETVEAINDAAAELVRTTTGTRPTGAASTTKPAGRHTPSCDGSSSSRSGRWPTTSMRSRRPASGSTGSTTARSPPTRRSGRRSSARTTRACSAGSAARSGSKACRRPRQPSPTGCGCCARASTASSARARSTPSGPTSRPCS